MFNARDLLGQLLDSRLDGSKTTANRLNHALGPQGLGGTNGPLASLFGGQSRGAAGQQGGLAGIMDMAKGLFDGASREVRSGNPLALGSLGALAGAVMGGGGGKSAGGALGGGALAFLGTLAYQAMRGQNQVPEPQDTKDFTRQAPLGLREPQNSREEQELDRRALLIVRAMISAAKADGEIDKVEVERITGKIDEAGLGQDALVFIQKEIEKPVGADDLIREVGSKEVALEVYAASLLAIEVDTEAEKRYLRGLAGGLGLEGSMVRYLHQSLGAPAPA
jgi:uncharacterized membrane protein YebE (DUF533 family)